MAVVFHGVATVRETGRVICLDHDNGGTTWFDIGDRWGGLICMPYRTTGSSNPIVLFRYSDIWNAQGAVQVSGPFSPVFMEDKAAEFFVGRGYLSKSDVETFQTTAAAHAAPLDDTALIARAQIAGATFTPLTNAQPLRPDPTVTGFAMRLLASSDRHILGVTADGLPELTDEARAALRRDLKLPG